MEEELVVMHVYSKAELVAAIRCADDLPAEIIWHRPSGITKYRFPIHYRAAGRPESREARSERLNAVAKRASKIPEEACA